MGKSRTSTRFRLVTALCCSLAAACSSGGGGGGAAPPAPAPQPVAATTGYLTGASGTVTAPASATFGTAPAQIATSGGPVFDGKGGPFPSNVTFPLISSSLQKSSSGLAAAAGDQGATATVVSTSLNSSTLQLTIPSLNVTSTIKLNTDLVSGLDQITDGYSYVVMGGWSQNASQPANTGALQSATAFAFGYETPKAGMPSTGKADFSGYMLGTVYKPVGADIQSAPLDGTSTFSVDFGSGQMSGGVNSTRVLLQGGGAWNDVLLTATIAAGSNRFSGTTTSKVSPGTPMSLSSSATGTINGAFFGPAAQNIGAVWSLSDGTGSALGTVVAK